MCLVSFKIINNNVIDVKTMIRKMLLIFRITKHLISERLIFKKYKLCQKLHNQNHILYIYSQITKYTHTQKCLHIQIQKCIIISNLRKKIYLILSYKQFIIYLDKVLKMRKNKYLSQKSLNIKSIQQNYVHIKIKHYIIMYSTNVYLIINGLICN